MTDVRLMLLRHAPTPWNRAKRIQGRSDVALDAAGRAEAAAWRLGAADRARTWYCSPLRRCRETAAALGLDAAADAALAEMDWGAWDGRSLADLRADASIDMAAREAQGLDFRPAGGESPREVQARLLPFLDRLRGAGRDAGAVTHKGVIRAMIGLACAWDMTTPCPMPIETGRPVRLVVTADGLTPEETA
jgi:broad specificity phosphatase PhoE